MPKRILVIAAHPDDEALGCGATLARHAAEGDEVRAVFVADGVSSRPADPPHALAERKAAMAEAARVLGITDTVTFDFVDNQLDQVPLLEIVRRIEQVVTAYRPDVVYTHHAGDLNVDHRITHQAVLTACRPLPDAGVQQILAFEVVSSTEWGLQPFAPNVFVDVSAYMPQKIAALQAYGAEMRPAPHARSLQHIEALAVHRGHGCGCAHAEAFVLVRSLR